MKYLSLVVLAFTGFTACSNPSSPDGKIKKEDLALPLTDTGKIIIVDVRTVDEWNNDGHADCSVNFHLDELNASIEKLKA
jgi:rhodanese-related sulfurtransferase